MKFLFSIIALTFTCVLNAQVGMDQYAQVCFSTTQTYGKALEICKEKGFSHFFIKKISYSDDRGQTLVFNGVSNAKGATLISETITQELGPPVGTLQLDFELYCYGIPPEEPLAIDVQDVFDFCEVLQNQQLEKVEESNILEVKTMEELKAELDKASDSVYLDCYAPNCPPCKILAPHFDQYSKDFSSRGSFLKVSLKNVPELRDLYKIQQVPTLILFKGQKEVERKVSLPAIMKYFESLRGNIPDSENGV